MYSPRKRAISRSRSRSRSRSPSILFGSEQQLTFLHHNLENGRSAEHIIKPELRLPSPPSLRATPVLHIPIPSLSPSLASEQHEACLRPDLENGRSTKHIMKSELRLSSPPSLRATPVLHIEVLDRVAVSDFVKGEGHVAMKEHYDDMSKRVNELSPPKSLGMPRFCSTPVSEVDNDTNTTTSVYAFNVDVSQPGPSGIQRASLSASETTAVVSESSKRLFTEEEPDVLDSDFEENLDELDTSGILKDIPDDEEEEELDQYDDCNINAVERALDDAFEQLIGVSTSFEWTEDFTTFQGVPKVFSGPTPGPIEDYNTPYDAFTAIWSEDIIDYIVSETNRYAKEVIKRKKGDHLLLEKSRLHRWTDTDRDEVYLLFAIFMLMGLDPRTPASAYWQSNGFLGMPRFRKLMRYNRFLLLNKFLHFEDKSVTSQDFPQNHKDMCALRLRKLAPIIGHLNGKFSSLYNLHPDIAIDESLTMFKGRLSWMQTIKSKAARFGIKSFELCESKSGYLYNFEIYTGKNSKLDSSTNFSKELAAKSAQVVIKLLSGLENRGHRVTMDNFYNSPALARYLKTQGFDCLGTLRRNRNHVPLDIKSIPRNVAKGTIIARHCGDLSCIAWQDTRLVTMISTYHNCETFVSIKNDRSVVKPVIVRDYNHTMGGVDLKDQKLSLYLLERKRCLKWYMKMFKRLLNVSVLNAYILLSASFKRRNLSLITHRQFREKLIESLVKEHTCLPLTSRSLVPELTRLRKDIVHAPKKHDRKDRKRCVICHRKGIDKKVLLSCIGCGEYMCFEDCWTVWHYREKLPGKDYHRRDRQSKHIKEV